MMLPRVLLSLTISAAAVRAAEPAASAAFFHTSWPEASGVAVVGTPPKWLAVIDNEMPRIAVYPLEPQAVKIHAPALVAAASPDYPVDDLEGMTVFPWDPNGDGTPEQILHVCAGSCGRTKKGKVAPERDVLFAVSIDTAALDAGKPGVFPAAAAVEFNRTLRAQIRALGSENSGTAWGPVLRDSVAPSGQDPGSPNFALAGGTAAGLSIEGLTVSSDARALLLGLRAPLINGRAVVVPLTNPVAALGLGESAPQPAALAAPYLLDLGGLGIRSIEWDALQKVYLIIAGAVDDQKRFRCFTWSGEATVAPVPVTGASALAVAELEPEGVTPVPGWEAAAVVGDGTAGAPYHKGMWVDFGSAGRAK